MSRDTLEQRLNMQLGILQALESLLAKKVYSRIKISEICEEAHVSKTTFYRYFKSKESIITWLAEHSLDCGVSRIGRDLNAYEGFLNTAGMHCQHRIFFCDDPQTEGVVTALIDFSSSHVVSALTETLKLRGVEVDEQLSYQIDFFAKGVGFVCRRWAVEGMRIPPATLASYFESLIPQKLAENLKVS